MSMDIALSAHGLRKVYQLYDRPLDRLRQMLSRDGRRYFREFVALDNVSFSLPRGQVLGLVGRNGAGKSTLLQLICNTLTPTSGNVVVNGRVAALLELGAGFNPEFTGRENVFLNASILGLSQREISARFDDIVAFSGIGDFIDQPVKTYSSGMYVRLAFSIATSVDPDILVVDEALSVGDGAFARKSFDRIMTLRERGATILFCSHSLYQIEAFCDQALWLERGRIMAHGDPAEVVAHYQQFLDSECISDNASSSASTDGTTVASGKCRIIKVWTYSGNKAPQSQLSLASGQDDLRVKIRFMSDTSLPIPTAAVTLHLPDGRTVSSGASWIHHADLQRNSSGLGEVEVRFPRIPLLKGEYQLSAHLLCEKGIHLYDSANGICALKITQDHLEQGLVSLPQEWLSLPPPETSPVFAQEASREISSAQWTIRSATPGDEDKLLKLFQRCFGHTMPLAQWRWKYADTDSPGMLAATGNAPVAFYGGMPRKIRYFGKAASAIQIGDVMVAPGVRSLLTRRGAFFQVASSFLERHIGHGKPYLLGFGFPTARALRLAELLGLYAKVGEMHEWCWPASPGRSSLRLRGRMIHSLASPLKQQLIVLWDEMANALPGFVIGERDTTWLTHRYQEHPTNRYQIWVITQRLTGKPVGALVLKPNKTEIELLDLLAPPERFPALIGWVRRFAGRSGRTAVKLLASSGMAQFFEPTGGTRKSPDLHIPCNIWSPGPSPDEIAGHWWLTGGDTDFR